MSECLEQVLPAFFPRKKITVSMFLILGIVFKFRF